MITLEEAKKIAANTESLDVLQDYEIAEWIDNMNKDFPDFKFYMVNRGKDYGWGIEVKVND